MRLVITLTVVGLLQFSSVLAGNLKLSPRLQGSGDVKEESDAESVLRLIGELARCPQCYSGVARYLQDHARTIAQVVNTESASIESEDSALEASNLNADLINKIARCPKCWLGIGLG